jgi:hypothetical protein
MESDTDADADAESVHDRVPSEPAALRRARAASRLLDDLVTVPGTRIGVGLDPLLSVVPGGTVVGGAASLYVVWEAARYGVPGRMLAHMLLNVLLDAAGGAVPIVGPLLDAMFQANERNVDLFARHVARERREEAFVAIEIE